MNCKVPRCYKTKANTCSVPNPWVVFNRIIKGRTLTKTQKETGYEKFLAKFKSIREAGDGDDKAYRAALCLAVTKPTGLPREPKKGIVSRFVERLMKERREIEMDCTMTPNLRNFFNQFVPTEIVGVPMNPCQLIAKFMLEKCVPRHDLKYYTFQDKISSGAHGLLISGTYKQKPVAIKIIPVHARRPYTLSFTADRHTKTIKSVPERNILRECDIQKHVASKTFRKFLVPAIHGDVSIIKSKKDPSRRVAVIVMEKVIDPIDLEKATANEQTNRLADIPVFLTELHKKGIVHGDLHMWNVLFTKDNPYVIDFGRSFIVKNFKNGNKQDAAMLTIMDYIIPLEMVLRGVNVYNSKTLGNMTAKYIDAMQKKGIKTHVQKLFDKTSNPLFNIDAQFVLSPLTDDKRDLSSLKERYDAISNLRFNYYYSKNRSWGHVLDI